MWEKQIWDAISEFDFGSVKSVKPIRHPNECGG